MQQTFLGEVPTLAPDNTLKDQSWDKNLRIPWETKKKKKDGAKLFYSVEFKLVPKKGNTSAYMLAKTYPS